MKRVMLIDNYDSFTYNLYQYLSELGAAVRVRRNDAVDLAGVARFKPAAIVVSPGPGRPEQAGICVDLIRAFAAKVPLLGVCLGHQAIAAAFGGKVVKARRLMHGKVSRIRHDRKGIFRGLPNPLEATRYHSLAVSERDLPRELAVTARSEDGTIMALRHRRFPCAGVQFHPESLMTPEGKQLLANFLGARR